MRALPANDPTDISYFLSRPQCSPMMDCQCLALSTRIPTAVHRPRACTLSVIDRLNSIIGSEVRQSELLTLRKTLFADILGKPSRSECRLKVANVAAFEAHRGEIMEMLDNRAVLASVTRIALRNRSKMAEKETVLMHVFNIC
jgi:hypothetical protein